MPFALSKIKLSEEVDLQSYIFNVLWGIGKVWCLFRLSRWQSLALKLCMWHLRWSHQWRTFQENIIKIIVKALLLSKLYKTTTFLKRYCTPFLSITQRVLGCKSSQSDQYDHNKIFKIIITFIPIFTHY